MQDRIDVGVTPALAELRQAVAAICAEKLRIGVRSQAVENIQDCAQILEAKRCFSERTRPSERRKVKIRRASMCIRRLNRNRGLAPREWIAGSFRRRNIFLTKRAPFYGRPSGVGSLRSRSPLRCIGTIHANVCTSSPTNFRRPRNKRHAACRDPTTPALRTGSTAPTRPGVEGRSGNSMSVSIFFNDHADLRSAIRPVAALARN